ncbi:ASCH domain-containing protein [Agromyces larvae]|uniref:ASCH domain-containing protein n=1 Tax=Agromyces larvae TaxID=2929802 RepID=A0ABY4BY20_9MICO|nr:ASCH domain-containing protein [Agromyces larvae]UOE44135.1 ASCH domain-containing protein [Agromyces larvae]
MENAPVDRAAADELWQVYRAAHPDRAVDTEPPSVERFGDHPALTDELLGLVLDGRKTATATLVAEFAAEGQPLPRIGSHWIACDSTGRPRVILRSIEFRIATFDEVDAVFAREEGEGDLSLAYWRDGHRGYWIRVCAGLGFDWTPEHEIVLERFEVAWTAGA